MHRSNLVTVKNEKGTKTDHGRGYNKQQKFDKRGLRTIQDEDQNDNAEEENTQQSFLDNGEEVQERH